MIEIFEIILVIFLWSKKYMPFLLWVVAIILLQMSFEYGNERLYLEIIEDYPIQECVKPKRMKILFKKLDKLSYKGIPKEMYYSEIIKVYGLVIYSVILVVLIFRDKHYASLCGIIYMGIVGALTIFCGFLMKKKSFLARYKILNKHNIKYIFLPGDEPYPRKIGTCYVINAYKKRRKRFATIQILETGEIKKKVLMEGKLHESEKWVYSVFEICKVYYIV